MKTYKSQTDYTGISIRKSLNDKISNILATKKQELTKRELTESIMITGLKVKKLW